MPSRREALAALAFVRAGDGLPSEPYLTGGSSMIVPQLVNARLVSTRKFDCIRVTLGVEQIEIVGHCRP